MALTQSQVSSLYVTIFGRASEGAGNTYWQTAAADLSDGATQMLDTQAATDYFGTSLDTDQAFIEHIYLNTLGKTYAEDTEGVDYWVGRLADGESRGAVVATLIEAVYTYADSTDATTKAAYDQFVNRVEVSDYCADTLDGADLDANDADAMAVYTAYISSVTDDASTVTAAQADIDMDANPGESFTLTTSTDVLVGTAGNDTFVGVDSSDTALDTYDDADRVVDSSTSDSDIYNLTTAATAIPDAVNVENVNVTTSVINGGANTVNASNLSGVEVLTVTGADLVVGGASIAGEKDVTVTGLDATKVAKVVAGDGAEDVVVTQATKAGVTVDADNASGDVTVTGAATVTASGAGTGDTVTVQAFTDAIAGTAAKAVVENAKAVTVSTAAQTVAVSDNVNSFTGVIDVTADSARSVTIDNAAGGATVSALRDSDATADTTINVNNIDDTGATITAGTGSKSGSSTYDVVVNLDGTTATSDQATVTAAGYVTLDASAGGGQLVDNLNLSGNGAAAIYTDATGDAGAATTVFTLSGDQDVTLSTTTAALTLTTVTDATTDATTVAKLTTVGASDLSKVATDQIQIAAAGSGDVVLADGANVVVAKDQTTLELSGKTTGQTLNLSTGDDTAASGATIDIAFSTALDVSDNFTTVNIDATTGKFSATATTAATTAAVVVTGSKDVALGNLTAKSLDATAATGKISLDTANVELTSIKTGSAADTVTVDQAAAYTVDLGAGDNVLTITTAADASSFTTGAGADTIAVDAANSIVVVSGAGNDEVTIAHNIDSDAIIVAGDGTDELIFADTDGNDFSTNANFAFSGFETLDISALTSGSITVSAEDFAANNTFKLSGNATADNLTVVNTSTTAGATIDASNVTYDSTVASSLTLQGGVKTDTITGSAKDDTITASAGGDTVDGGLGTDTYDAQALDSVREVSTATNASQGVVINLGNTAVTATTVLAATSAFTAQGLTSISAGTVAYTYSADAADNSAVVSTLSNIENVVGSDGKDYIVASSAGSSITAGTGVDYVVLGTGADVIVSATTDIDTTDGAVTDIVSGF